MNNCVSFKLNKLLKEKGCIVKGNGLNSPFYVLKNTRYCKEGELTEECVDVTCCESNPVPYNKRLYALTIAEVVMWLYEKYGIWVNVKMGVKVKTFDFLLQKEDEDLPYNKILNRKPYFNSPTEAYEAAIKYCLEKII